MIAVTEFGVRECKVIQVTTLGPDSVTYVYLWIYSRSFYECYILLKDMNRDCQIWIRPIYFSFSVVNADLFWMIFCYAD